MSLALSHQPTFDSLLAVRCNSHTTSVPPPATTARNCSSGENLTRDTLPSWFKREANINQVGASSDILTFLSQTHLVGKELYISVVSAVETIDASSVSSQSNVVGGDCYTCVLEEEIGLGHAISSFTSYLVYFNSPRRAQRGNKRLCVSLRQQKSAGLGRHSRDRPHCRVSNLSAKVILHTLWFGAVQYVEASSR